MSESKKRLTQWREGQAKQQTNKEALLPPPPPPPDAKPALAEIPFVPSTIVKFSLAEPIDDKQLLKKKVRSAFLFPVEYVDAEAGKTEFHVRCSDDEQAKKLVGVTCLGTATILSGEEVKYVFILGGKGMSIHKSSPKERVREGEIREYPLTKEIGRENFEECHRAPKGHSP